MRRSAGGRSRGILDPGMTLLAKPFNGLALDHCLAQVLGEPVKAAAVSAPTMH